MSKKQRLALIALYVLMLLLVASGAFNYGMTRFFWAIPPSIGAVFLAYKLFGALARNVTLVWCIVAFLFNFTLERNPFIFPILKDGLVTIEQDGYLYRGYPSLIPVEKYKGLPAPVDDPIKKGTTFKIEEIRIFHAVENPRIARLYTENGLFFEYRFGGYSHPYSLNKPIESTLFSHFGDLMNYPLLPFFIANLFNELRPAVEIVLENDQGAQKAAMLKGSVARSWGVKRGDLLKIECPERPPSLSHITHKCQLIWRHGPEKKFGTFKPVFEPDDPRATIVRYK